MPTEKHWSSLSVTSGVLTGRGDARRLMIKFRNPFRPLLGEASSDRFVEPDYQETCSARYGWVSFRIFWLLGFFTFAERTGVHGGLRSPMLLQLPEEWIDGELKRKLRDWWLKDLCTRLNHPKVRNAGVGILPSAASIYLAACGLVLVLLRNEGAKIVVTVCAVLGVVAAWVSGVAL